ncbi:MAG TPA: hypothetical protein VL485_18660 [Ktedonobacteraceae bacterium]|jgi:nucleoside phosphorylase|nr:hypothetical protein [Ktedonobacteraceae bacterium]
MEPEHTIFLSNDPLPFTEGQVTREVLSETDPVRGPRDPRIEEKIPYGKVTFNPHGCQIIALPPASGAARALHAVDSSHWDLYLIIIPFTLHPPYKNSAYERFSFFVEMDDPQATAYDLFPRQTLTPTLAITRYTISAEGKFQKLTSTDATNSLRIDMDILHPKILAYGEGEQKFYWLYTEGTARAGVIAETKHTLLVLRVPTGTSSVSGNFYCRAEVMSNTFGLRFKREASVNTVAFRWDMAQAAKVSQAPLYDVCLVCALAEEAKALIAEITRQCQVTFQEGYSPTLKRDYRHTTIQNRHGEPLSIHISWQTNPGAVETGLHLTSLLREIRPRFVGMTGMCAGDQTQVALGDIVVAERAFFYDSGELAVDDRGRKVYRHNTTTWQPHQETLHTLRMFTDAQALNIHLSRPISRRQQRDWLLSTLYESGSHRLTDLTQQDLQQYAPHWRKILPMLKSGERPFLSEENELLDPDRVGGLYYGEEEFPYRDPAVPAIHIKPIASGNTERADNPFAEIRYPVQGTVAVDLEGAAFYRTLADFPETPAFLAKGVCDYADQTRDETYRAYASTVAAAYMLGFLQAHVRGQAVM